jgi:hypothetical protein
MFCVPRAPRHRVPWDVAPDHRSLPVSQIMYEAVPALTRRVYIARETS